MNNRATVYMAKYVYLFEGRPNAHNNEGIEKHHDYVCAKSHEEPIRPNSMPEKSKPPDRQKVMHDGIVLKSTLVNEAVVRTLAVGFLALASVEIFGRP